MKPKEQVDIIIDVLQNIEWAWSCSPSRPEWDSREWARDRALAIVGALENARKAQEGQQTFGGLFAQIDKDRG